MADQMKRKGITVDIKLLEKELGNEVVLISVRKATAKGVEEVKKAIVKTYNSAKAFPFGKEFNKAQFNHRAS